ncbi:uncharacterized protein BBA_10322 [Beauveria bassiana ARSEF 2860]|uniref:Uncharacterized protein n=1 Tax=Beauveria bassiana (strain ARSEF 2860) TaxID=655819 RepID=J5J9H0_BEAB2|nr:uncharacterized protein BBA_10322 [Beauveria bassiana ARSEF 2860]EJP60731.1 hypothetical protein BBA_10322 [Beauveria bassiana ARSEF 2860]
MARVETTFGADSSAVRTPNHAPSSRDPAASPQSPVGPSDETKDGPRTEILQTAAGGIETSGGSNVGRSSRAVDHDREHAGNRHNSVFSQQASPPLTTGIGFNIAELAAKALETAGVPESQDLPKPETAGHTAAHFAVVIPKPDDESQVQTGQGSVGTKFAEQSKRQTRGMNATTSESLNRRNWSATSRTVPPTIEDTAGETLSTGKSTGMENLPRVAVSNTPQSGSGVDGLPRSGSKPQTTSLDNTGETIETEDSTEAADAGFRLGGVLQTEVQGARAAAPQAATAPRTSTKGKRKATAGHTAIKRLRKAFGTETVLLTTKDTADETTRVARLQFGFRRCARYTLKKQPTETSIIGVKGSIRCESRSQHAESRRDSVSSRRRELWVLKAEMMEHFDQNAASAAAAAALHELIYQAENNLITHYDVAVLNDGIA